MADPTGMAGVKLDFFIDPDTLTFKPCVIINLGELEVLEGSRQTEVKGDWVSLEQLMYAFRLGDGPEHLASFYYDVFSKPAHRNQAAIDNSFQHEELRHWQIYRWKQTGTNQPEVVEIKPDPRVHEQPGDPVRWEVIPPSLDHSQPIFIVLPLTNGYEALLDRATWLRKVRGERADFGLAERLHRIEQLVWSVLHPHHLLERELLRSQAPAELGRIRLMHQLLVVALQAGRNETGTIDEDELPSNDELWRVELLKRATQHLYESAESSLVKWPQLQSKHAKKRNKAAKKLLTALDDRDLEADIGKLIEHRKDAPEDLVDKLLDVLSEAARALLVSSSSKQALSTYLEPLLHRVALQVPDVPTYPYSGDGLEPGDPKNVFARLADADATYGKFTKTITIIAKAAGPHLLVKMTGEFYLDRAKRAYVTWAYKLLSHAAGFDEDKRLQLASALFKPDSDGKLAELTEDARSGFGEAPFAKKVFASWAVIANTAKLVSVWQTEGKKLARNWAEIAEASIGLVDAGKTLTERFITLPEGTQLSKGWAVAGKALGVVTVAVAIWVTHNKIEAADERGDFDAANDAMIGGVLAVMGGLASLAGAGPVGLAIAAIGVLYGVGKWTFTEYVEARPGSFYYSLFKQVGTTNRFVERRWREPAKTKLPGDKDDPARKQWRRAIQGTGEYLTKGVLESRLLVKIKIKSTDYERGVEPDFWDFVDQDEGEGHLASYDIAVRLKSGGFDRGSVARLLPKLRPKHLEDLFPTPKAK